MSTILNIPIRKVFRGRDRRRRWGLAVPVVTFLALSLLARSSRADLSLSITPLTSTATTGSFEVDVSNPGSDVTVNAFTIELTLPNLAGVVFTGASTNTTTDPYIFASVGGEAYFGSSSFQFASLNSPTDLVASDNDWLSPVPTGGTLPAITVSNGASYGLAVVSYDASGAPAGSTNPINFFSTGTSASDTNFGTINLDYSTPAGEIVVSGTIAVPEPSTLVLFLATALPVLVAGGFFRARAAIRNRSSEAKSQHPQPL